jgi:hypothetical protein
VVTVATPALPTVVVDPLGGAMTTTPRSKLRTLLTWPVDSQHTARRNALVASTALAQLRHERLEVELFLDEHARRRTTASRTERAAGA